MANKRQKKKQARSIQNRALQSVGYSRKQINRLSSTERKSLSKPIISKKERSRKAKQSYKKRQNYIDKYNVKGVKKNDSWDTIKQAHEKQVRNAEKVKRSMAAKRSLDDRKNFIDLYGLKGVKPNSSWKDIRTAYFKAIGIKNVPPDWVKSEKAFEKRRNIQALTFTAEDWLYIGYGDPSQNVNIASVIPYYQGETMDFYENVIQNNLPRKGEPPDASSGRPGNTVILRGSYKKVKRFMEDHEKRGYQTICFSNTWTLYGLKQVEAVTMDLSTSSNIRVIEEALRNYVKVNIPTLKDYF